MNKIVLVLLISLTSFGSDSGGNEDQTELPALSSNPKSSTGWASFETWQCFNADNVSFECADYDETKMVPSVKAELLYEIVHFDLHPNDNFDCESVLQEWNNLTSGSQEICFYAAQMFGVDLGLERGKSQALWYLSAIRSGRNLWQSH